MANQRKDFLHKLSLQIIRDYDIICVEKLNIKDMQKSRSYFRSIHDASWSIFINILEYKAKLYGKKIIKIDNYYPSSQKCSNCGYINEKVKSLKIREWECPICRHMHDRDVNAAINILNEGLKQIKNITVGATEIDACGDE